VIHSASASPIPSEEENPDPLHPLATHSPGRSGTGPATNRPSGLMVNNPPRISVTGPLAAAGAWVATMPASLRNTSRSSGTSSVLNDAGSRAGSTGSASASNPPTMSPPRAGRR
jgi:hypothetical protein